MLLTWAQVGNDFDTEIAVRLVTSRGGTCVLAQENHKDGGIHYHMFAQHPDRFQFRGHDTFDVGNYHCNIVNVKQTPWAVWDYVRKDGNVIHDGIPERPVSKRKRKDDTLVYDYITAAPTADQMLKRFKESKPRDFFCAFNNVKAGCEYLQGPEELPTWIVPDNFVSHVDRYPQISDWCNKYIGAANHRDAPARTPDLTDGSSAVSGGESWDMERWANEDWRTLLQPGELPDERVLHDGESILPSIEQEEDGLFLRCDTPSPLPKKTNTSKPRAPSLIIWGTSRLCKTQWARSLGRHTYFANEFNLAGFDDASAYAIFDDIQGGMGKIAYKAWIGGQSQFDVSDKYTRKRRIYWNRPCIFIANENPFETESDKHVDKEWLALNTICVHITEPLGEFTVHSQ